MTALLNTAREPRLRAAIGVALGASRDGNAGAVLETMLEDPVPAVRYMAVEGLERLGAADAAPALAALAKPEAATLAGETALLVDDPLRTVAVLSLQTRALRAAVELDPGTVRQALIEAAAPLPIPFSSARALKVAGAVYRRRRMALYGLGYVDPGPDVVNALAAGLKDSDPRLRAVAVRSLGVLHSPDAAATVRSALTDPNAEVRMTAARVLGRLGSPDSVPALETAASDSWALVREEAALALSYIGEPSAAPLLRDLAVRDESRAVREAAAYAASLIPAGG